ncbi:hypothetical protein ACJIZ3_008050 [Penstemon smallii]|uniref:Uncharacterized protein n=1 Tax=Penstemon smallii TaxID=265156 RepID=A0ABD3T8P0_9LAMI
MIYTWHRPEEDPLHLPDTSFSDESHFRLNEEVEEDRGGFLVQFETTANGCLMSESPVNDEITGITELREHGGGETGDVVVTGALLNRA